jgi:hypothetical protein
MKIRYQCYQSYVPGLERLWEEETDWGTLTEDLKQWFFETPGDKPYIVAAHDEDSGDIVGQFLFLPSLVCVNGCEVRAIRPFGTIVSTALRGAVRSPNPLHQPAAAMYLHAVKELQARHYRLVHMLPNPAWARFFRMLPFLHSASFPLWSLRLPLAADAPALALGDGFTNAPPPSWDDGRVNRLWQTWSGFHACSLVRDARILPWKIKLSGYHLTAVERNGELVGLAASRQKGEGQYLICDLLAADMGDALRATLAAVVNRGHMESMVVPSNKPIRKVALLVTPRMEPVVRDLGFERDAYNFSLTIHILDPTLSKEEVDPKHWYVSAND